MKKNVIIALACSVVAIACHNAPKNTNPGGFIIEGTVKGMDTGWIYFGHNDSNGFVSDSAHIKGGQFTFTGKVSESAEFFLWLKLVNGKMVDPFDFFVEDTLMQMNVNKDSLVATGVTGSNVENLYLQYKQALKPVTDERKALSKAYNVADAKNDQHAMDSLDVVSMKSEEKFHEAIVDYVSKNPSSVIGAWSVRGNLLYNEQLKNLQKFYSEFTPAVQQSKYGKAIKKEIDIEEKMQVGMVAPDFTMNDSTGKPVTLSSFKGKYVLVDFWASWCGPCRRENPNVVEAYKKFKDKNFTILGVSLDENKDAWMKAIKDDGLVWNHVCDLKGWQNAAAQQYGIRSIPSNYLLDTEGKILAHNLRGEELEKTLAGAIK
jgi:peroxiredoxin